MLIVSVGTYYHFKMFLVSFLYNRTSDVRFGKLSVIDHYLNIAPCELE